MVHFWDPDGTGGSLGPRGDQDLFAEGMNVIKTHFAK